MVTPNDIKEKLLESSEVQELIDKIDKALMEEDNMRRAVTYRVQLKFKEQYPIYVRNLIVWLYKKQGWSDVEVHEYTYIIERYGSALSKGTGTNFIFYL